eukprot:COSAG02_NODE_2215_length_9489_cov_4.810011_6_plen_95_part_00
MVVAAAALGLALGLAVQSLAGIRSIRWAKNIIRRSSSNMKCRVEVEVAICIRILGGDSTDTTDRCEVAISSSIHVAKSRSEIFDHTLITSAMSV